MAKNYLFINAHFGRMYTAWTVHNGRPQATGDTFPSGNIVKCFCALVVTAKRSVDELFMQYFHNLSASGGLRPCRPHRGSIPGPHWVTFVSRPPAIRSHLHCMMKDGRLMKTVMLVMVE